MTSLEENAMRSSDDQRPRCDHICLLDDGHVERGEGHFYGYELPSPRAAKRDVPGLLAVAEAAKAAVAELNAEHYADPELKGRGCVMCWPKDGSWPCVSRMVSDELARVLDTLEEK